MSHGPYSSLALEPGSIRLLRLMPNKDEAAAIQCELFNYSLEGSGKATHLYEALSYVWGYCEPDERPYILIGEHRFNVTVNLYAALSRLRDPTLERIIWVDAVCINQENKQEKERQVQSMARIYGQANCVIVWLGEATDDSDQALEEIRVAADDESTKPSNNETIREAFIALLRRSWFRRIWVLQEVAAARHILIMCGATLVDGYAFCLGLSRLERSYQTPLDLQSLIRSVTYVIMGAIFRPRYKMSRPGRISPDLRPLGELIDMYHTHEATLHHDKVYALLGMSSDDLGAAGLSPDYTVSWEELFQRLITFILCEEVSVETWGDREVAVITSKGCILGRVSSVEINSARYDRQNVGITLKSIPEHSGLERERDIYWTLQASAKSIRNGDLVCLLQGAPLPTIVRKCKDHFAIITIAVTPRQDVRTEGGYVKLLRSMNSFPRNFLLIWNWEGSPENPPDREGYETSTEINNLLPEYLNTGWDKATRLRDVGLIFDDLEEYEEAERRFQGAIGGYERVIGKEHPDTLKSMDNLSLIYKKKKQWNDAKELFLQVIETRKRAQGADHSDTLSTIANLASIYKEQGHFQEAEKLEMMIHLLKQREDDDQTTEGTVAKIARSFDEEVMRLLFERRDDVQITEKVVKAAAENSSEKTMRLLFERKGDDIQVTEEVIKTAAENLSGEVMRLLLERRGDSIQITEEIVKAAVENRNGIKMMSLLLERKGGDVQVTGEIVKAAIANQDGIEMMRFLLERREDDVQVTEKVVKAAAGNEASGDAVMMLLLERKGDDIQITEDMVAQIARSFNVKVMRFLLEQREDDVQVTEKVVKAAAGNKASGEEVMRLLLERRGDDVQLTEEVVKAAAGNEWRGEKVMGLLLEQKGDEVQVTEEVVKAAAGNKWSGEEVMRLLLERRGDDVQITEEVVKAAAGNEWRGEEVMRLLLERKGDNFQVTEEVVKAAAENEYSGKEVMRLLLEQKGDDVQITEKVVKAAAGNSSGEMMRLLLERKRDDVQVTEEVVKAAAGNERSGEEVMRLLLERKGDDVQITEKVVNAAAGNSSGEMMRLLLERKRDDVQVTEEVLKAAAGNERSGEEVMRLLLERKGDDVQGTEEVVKAAAGYDGHYNKRNLASMIMNADIVKIAATCGQERMLELLHEWCGLKDRTAWIKVAQLYNAAKNGKLYKIQQLLREGVVPDLKNIRGVTPLWQAASNGHADVVKVLLATGAVDVNPRNQDGKTPLFRAAINGYVEVVRLLLSHGASHDYEDRNGRTPLSIAQEYRRTKVIEILQHHSNQELDGNGPTIEHD